MKSYFFLAIQFIAIIAYSQNYHLNENFNNSSLPSAWTNNAISGTQVWSFGINGANAHSGNQNLNGTPMAYFDDDALGSSSLNNTVELITPSFDNSGEPFTYLSFEYNFRAFSQASDSFYVDIYDGSQWQRVFTRTIDDCGNYTTGICINNFPTAFIDLSAYANANCQVRFTYHDGNDWGWYVGLDNVQIWSPYANDLSVATLLEPQSECGLSSTDSIKVLISNQGYLTQQNFDIAFELDGNPAVVETISDSLAYHDSLIFTFSNTGNFSSFGLHNLKVYTSLPNDSNLINDSLSVQISNDSIYQLPYFNDFENANNGWSTSGTNSSWEWGVPAGSVIDSAYSGQNAWVTNLNGTYNSSELSYLISPCFDFSKDTVDPIINFYINHRIEQGFDKLWLESSINNGQTWQKVNSTSFASNWYNISNRQTWEGFSNRWVKATNILSNLAGESLVKLRFVFDSDGGLEMEGVGIDNISITKRQSIDLSIEQIKHPGDSSLCGYGSTERINMELKNYGSNPIDSFQVFYQLDNLPLDSEWVSSTIDTLSTYMHLSQLIFDLSQQKSYTLKIWISVVGDTNYFNDTLTKTFNHSNTSSSLPIPYAENFNSFVSGAANQNGWDTNPVSQSSFSFGWRAGSSPTSANNSTFVYLETSQNGNDGVLISPCIDLNNVNGAILSFKYNRYGPTMQPTYIDVFDGSNWVNVDVITQQPQNSVSAPWTYHETNLNAFTSGRTKIRFRGSAVCCTGDMAIDDVMIKPAKFQIVNLSNSDDCNLNDKLPIDIMLINNTRVYTSSGEIVLSYTINGIQTTYDTLNQNLGLNDTIFFSFNDSINLNQLGAINSIQVKATHINPNIILADSVRFDFIQPFVNENFSEDFESFNPLTLNSLFWNFSSNWVILNDTINNNTLIKNKTFKGSQFLHSNSNTIHDANFESNCINTSKADSLDLVFWYNIQGTPNSKLYVYDKSDSTEVLIDSILGSSPSGQWKRKHTNLNAYLDSSFVLGFRFIDTNPNQTTSINLDDIQLLEQKSPYDARTNDVEVSLDGCDYSSKTISILVENMGLDSIPAHTVEVNYQIDQNTAVKDTIPQSIAAGEIYTHSFSTPVNFNQVGNTYNLSLWTKLNGDLILDNDSLFTTYKNHTEVDSLYEDFESFVDFNCNSSFKDELKNGWHSTNNTWGVHNTGHCSPYPFSGPAYDHTNLNGQFVYIEPSNNVNQRAELYSPCVDVSNVSAPTLSYWYHLYGSDIDTFWVEVNLNGQWQVIDSLIGQQQTFSGAPWILRSISLNNFKSASPLQFRFSSQIKGRFNRLALDDISIADSLITSIKNSKQRAAVNYKLYPNPSMGQFTLDVDQSFLGERYRIHELSGKVVQEGKISSTKNHIQLNENAKGIYFLSIPNKNVREKVVVY